MWNIVSKIEKEKEKTQSAACFIDKGAETESDIVYFFFLILSYCVVVNTEVNNLNALVMWYLICYQLGQAGVWLS